MKSGVPWSVKGIEPEAREAAKQAARRAGLTLGTWLNQVILDTSTDEVGTPSPRDDTPAPDPFYRSYQQAPSLDLAPITDAVRSLAGRLGENEQRLDTAIEAMSARLNDPARYQPALDFDPLERKIQQLTERLEAAEQGRSFGKRAEDAQAIKSLEKAVTAVVDHLESAEHQTDRRFDEIRATLSGLSHRMDETEQAAEREKARGQTEALYKSVHALAERMASMEKSVGTALSGLDTVQTRAVEAALKTINEKADADNQKSLITGLQDALVKMNARLEESEKRQAETQHALFTQFQEGMTALGARLEEAQKEAAKKPESETGEIVSEIMREVDQRLADVSRRVEESEEQSRAVSGSVERALADMQASLSRLAEKQETPKAGSGNSQSQPETAAPFAGLAGGAMPPPVGAMSFNPPPPPTTAGAAAPLSPESSMPPPPPPGAMADGAQAEMRSPSPEGVSPVPPPHQESYGTPQPGAHDIRAGQDFIAAARRAAQAAATGEAPRGPVQEASPRYKNFDAEEGTDKRRKLIYAGAALLIVAGAFLAGRAWLGGDSEPAETAAVSETAPAEALPPRIPETRAAPAKDTAPESAKTGTQEKPEAIPVEGGTEAAPADAANGSASVPSPSSKEASPPAPAKPAKAEPAETSIMPRVNEKVPAATPAPIAPVERAAPAARQSLRETAAAGNAPAQFEVGLRYARGEGVPQDFEQAAYWFEQAADQDLAIAQYRLATLYEKGRGVPQDYDQARTLYESAAGKGNVKAMHNLAVIYAEGKGTDQNFEQAARYFEEAAAYGLADSQFNIAVLYERGLGMTADPAKAYHWYAIAAKGGDKDAAAKRDEIGDTLSASALADARMKAETWQPEKADPVVNGDLSSKATWSSAAASTTSGGNNSVARAQKLLNELGYDAGPADGIMGPRTRDAIALFQSRAGVPASGQVSGELIGLLETYVR